MAALEIPGNGDTGQKITEESIQNTLQSLEDPLQRVRDVTPMHYIQGRFHDALCTQAVLYSFWFL